MLNRPYHLLLPALLLLPVTSLLRGGWATITLEDLPEYAVAGKPLILTFMVRQHGVTPLKGLQPAIEARAGRLQARAAATAGKAAGQYVVSLVLPEPGDWTVTIQSGFGNSKLTLLPLRTVATAAATPVAFTEPERGRQLFVAKGCVGCHVRAEGKVGDGAEIGPSLTGKHYAADYLTRFLANPAMADRPRSGTFVMPNLELKPTEIAALVAFLNQERRADQR
ncbi:MAG TPA: cytochrome c [Gemmatimonadales bacterium]|jgi:mono/diheme cytochrome c family protein|nr:cytochrome c [Gemmatimonadales bacterium]